MYSINLVSKNKQIMIKFCIAFYITFIDSIDKG